MTKPRWRGPLGIVVAAGLLAGSTFVAPAQAAQNSVPPTTPAIAAKTVPPDRTSTAERHRVDRVKVPKPGWFNCAIFAPRAQCATVKLPVDYDSPQGATTEVALLRIKAKDQKNRIGTLFLNPGGPGGSGIDIASAAPGFLSAAVLARFDIVGFDPRGVNFSANVRCWKNLGTQADALAGLGVPYPSTAVQRRAYVSASQKFGKACSSAGKPLSASMSTAQVARDMDVLRRTLGDTKLNYLGFSYGSYLGTVYANMFPDRVRAVAIDGVIDPVAWAGTSATAKVPQTQRIKSGQGAAKALQGILARCKSKGPTYCMLAAAGDPAKLYRAVRAELKKSPLKVTDPESGELYFTMTEPDLTATLLSFLYSPYGSSSVDGQLSSLVEMLKARAVENGTVFPSALTATKARTDRARSTLVAQIRKQRSQAQAQSRESARKAAASGFAFPYDNSPEAFQSVLCTDGRNPARASDWVRSAAIAEITAPGFGQLWTWSSSPCATTTWTARDEDSYRGPFTRRTAQTVLVVGNYWDPATNYAGAQRVSKLLPNSRLLSSNSWGHTAYGTSKCVTSSVDKYLLTTTVPAAGKVCIGDEQPFTLALDAPGFNQRRLAPQRELPPVVPPLPGALPRS